MLIKDILIKEISVKQDIPENVIAQIVSHQFDSASEATVLNNSIEISGFAKFIFNQKRAHKQMAKYESQLELFSGAIEVEGITEAEYRKLDMRLDTVKSNIKHLKPKLKYDEPKSDDRRVEE